MRAQVDEVLPGIGDPGRGWFAVWDARAHPQLGSQLTGSCIVGDRAIPLAQSGGDSAPEFIKAGAIGGKRDGPIDVSEGLFPLAGARPALGSREPEVGARLACRFPHPKPGRSDPAPQLPPSHHRLRRPLSPVLRDVEAAESGWRPNLRNAGRRRTSPPPAIWPDPTGWRPSTA
jgi:hypothetical protein